MTCREYRKELIELARGGTASPSARIHAGECEGCARFLDAQTALTAAMADLSIVEFAAGQRMAPRVAAELDRALRPARLKRQWVLAAALAASLCAGAVWVQRQGHAGRAAFKAPDPETRPFLTIPYTVPISPQEAVAVVRTRIPVTQLINAGFRVGAAAADPNAVVEADVLVGEDGRARAVRPLSISMSN
jgi:hypothetical protein